MKTVIPARARRARRRLVVQGGCFLALVLTILLTAHAERMARVQSAVCADTLRLHILANSDAPADQYAKLRARDAVLRELVPLLGTAAGKPEALRRVAAALPRLERAASRAAGQPASVSLERAAFTAKDYGSFALPSGVYAALRIRLGRGKGHNWFCVLYPALCLPGAQGRYPTAAENELVFGDYAVRFALWDLLTGALKR